MLLVAGGVRALDPLADLLEHPDGVEVAVALQAEPVGEHDPHVVQGAQHRHRLVLVQDHLAVTSPGRVEDPHHAAEVGELRVGQIALAQASVLLGERRVLRRGGEQTPHGGVRGGAGLATGELGLEPAQRVLALGGAPQRVPALVDAEVPADQVRGLLGDLGDDRLLLAVEAAGEGAVWATSERMRHQPSPAFSIVDCSPKECMACTSVSAFSREPRETIARPSSWTCIISCSATTREYPK